MKKVEPDNTGVLIAGAGPAGLMTACRLASLGINFRIIDKKASSSPYSGAMILHAASLELLSQLGIAEKAVEKGIPVRSVSVFYMGRRLARIPLKNFGAGLSAFPYMLLLEQSETERLLTGYIEASGFYIERETELTGFEIQDDGVLSHLKKSSGSRAEIRSGYLVAADGGKSTIRSQLNIPFYGKTHKRSLFTIDCKSDISIPHDEICFTFSHNGTAGFFPISDGRWRIDGIRFPGKPEQNVLSFENMAENFGKTFGINARVFDADWFSEFRSHYRYSPVFRFNRCFFIGDAAHLYSPVGAQGMNSGFQDACNLAWKLALVIRGYGGRDLLDTYDQERKTIAHRTSAATDRIFDLISTKKSFFRITRNLFLPLVIYGIKVFTRIGIFRDVVFRTISQTGSSYRNSFLNRKKRGILSLSPRAGNRLPYIIYIENGMIQSLHESVKGDRFHLFVFSKKFIPEEFIKLNRSRGHLLSAGFIPFHSGTAMVYKKMRIKQEGFCLVRPDLYIACMSHHLNENLIKEYMEKILSK